MGEANPPVPTPEPPPVAAQYAVPPTLYERGQEFLGRPEVQAGLGYGAAAGGALALLYYLIQKTRGKRTGLMAPMAAGLGLGALAGGGFGGFLSPMAKRRAEVAEKIRFHRGTEIKPEEAQPTFDRITQLKQEMAEKPGLGYGVGYGI